jgi:hypothetical protein
MSAQITEEQETDAPLPHVTKIRLARLALRIFFDDPSEVAPVWLFEIADELDRQLGSAGREQRTDTLREAAERYIARKDSGEKVSVGQIAQEFSVSDRTLHRYILRRRTFG